jgi:hypothetical protein
MIKKLLLLLVSIFAILAMTCEASSATATADAKAEAVAKGGDATATANAEAEAVAYGDKYYYPKGTYTQFLLCSCTSTCNTIITFHTISECGRFGSRRHFEVLKDFFFPSSMRAALVLSSQIKEFDDFDTALITFHGLCKDSWRPASPLVVEGN